MYECVKKYISTHTQTFWKFLSYAKIFEVFLYDTGSLDKSVCTSTLSQYKYTALKYRSCTSSREVEKISAIQCSFQMIQGYCLHQVFSCLSKSSQESFHHMLQIITLPNGHHSTFNFTARSFLFFKSSSSLTLFFCASQSHPVFSNRDAVSFFLFFLFFFLIPAPVSLSLWHHLWLSFIPFQVFQSVPWPPCHFSFTESGYTFFQSTHDDGLQHQINNF